MKIDLKDVTLCVADSVTPDLSIRAIKKSQEQCNFGRSIFFTDVDIQSDDNYEIIKIKKIKSINDYSNFIIKDLNSHIKTKYALVIQWDGYVIDANMWRNEFLYYDYIGAKWDWHKDGKTVGNGGFSLRSKKLLNITASSDFLFIKDIPEDVQICRLNRQILVSNHSINFADENTADFFSYERSIPNLPSFGFHGLFNMWRHCEDKEMGLIVKELDAHRCKSREYIELMIQFYALRKFKLLKEMYNNAINKMTKDDFFKSIVSETGNHDFARMLFKLCLLL